MISLKKEVFVQKCSWDWMRALCELAHCHLKGLCDSYRMLLSSNYTKYHKARQAAYIVQNSL